MTSIKPASASFEPPTKDVAQTPVPTPVDQMAGDIPKGKVARGGASSPGPNADKDLAGALPEVEDLPEAADEDDPARQMLMIAVRNLEFRRGERLILRDVNLDVPHGQILALMGMSGCGKSTLLRLIAGLEKPSHGQIFIAGTDIAPMRENDLRRMRQSIGFVFQGAALFDYLTIFENVAFPLRRHTAMSEKEIAQRVSERLSLVGLEGTENLLPSQLSGGMQKRVGLARAITTAMPPQIILYDEPTGGLDPIMTAVINDLIVRVRDELDVTSVVVTHDMATLKLMDQVAMIHNGIIEAVGSPAELLTTTNGVVDQFIHGRSKGPIDIADSDIQL